MIYNGEGFPLGVNFEVDNYPAPAGTIFFDMSIYGGNAVYAAEYDELLAYPYRQFPNGGESFGGPLISDRVGWTLNEFYSGRIVGTATGGAMISGDCRVGGSPIDFPYPTNYTVYYNADPDGHIPPTRQPDPPPPKTTGPLILSAEQAAPAQHRKVALDGRPLPDGKPQTAPETDAAPEESFVDAFTLGLHHDTTDIYIPVASTDLALQVRRSTIPEVWSQRSGLRPDEAPDRPFGSAWTSNLGANIHFVRHNPLYPASLNLEADYAYVTDEDGSSYRFVITKDPNDASGKETYVPLPGSRNQQEAYLNTLTGDGVGHWTLQRKYGARLTYADASINFSINGDRLTYSSFVQDLHSFARLTQVGDRTGASLTYSYPNGVGTLIPSRIEVTGHAAQALTIQTDGTGKIVQSVSDPLGHTWNYSYQTQTYTFDQQPAPASCSTLTGVQGPDGAATTYGYSTAVIDDTLPGGRLEPHLHCDVGSIRNPLGKTYTFNYVPDQSSKAGLGSLGFFPAPGQARVVSQVVLPDGLGTTVFYNKTFIAAIPGGTTGPVFYGHKATYVVDALGNGRVYQFTQPSLTVLASFQPFLPNREILDPYHVPHIVLFGAESITFFTGSSVVFNEDASNENSFTFGGPQIGSESFTFDLAAGMAPATATDLSGNTTTFAYGDAWDFTSHYPFLTGTNYAFGKYADPTSQTNAQSSSRTFAYFPAPTDGSFEPRARRMTRIVDEAGRRTDYTLDAYGNRTGETIYEANGALAQQTDFAYEAPAFPGFMTRRTVHTGPADPAWAVDLVTTYVPDTLGRVASETVAPGSLNLTTGYTYDNNNNKKTVEDPRHFTTSFNYDLRNRLTEVVYPATAAGPGTNHKLFGYDPAGRKTSETDERGVQTLYSYDGMGRLVRTVRDMDGSGTETPGDLVTHAVTFDATGNKIYDLDPSGNLYTYSYDALGRVRTKTDPTPFNYLTSYYYNGPNAGGGLFASSSFHPTSVQGPRGYTSVFSYDSLYRLVGQSVQYGMAPDPVASANTVFGYDAVGNRTQETDDCNNVTKYSFDALNRTTSTTFAWGTADQANRSTVYTKTGLPWQSTDENSHITETRYDPAGRAEYVVRPTVDDGTGTGTTCRPQTRKQYDDNGNLAALTDEHGKKWDYSYDERNRRTVELAPAVVDAEHAPNGSAVRPETDMAYDKAGNLVSRVDPRGYTTTFVIDPANRQTEIHPPAVPCLQADGTSVTGQPITYTTYFANGAVRSVQDANGNSTTNTLDSLNRLATTTDAELHGVAYEYDADGNRSKVTDGKLQVTSYRYDGLNRLLETNDGINPLAKLTYNGVNKTKRSSSSGRVTTYEYDHRNRLSKVNYADFPDNNLIYSLDGVGNVLAVTLPNRSDTFCDAACTYDALDRVSTEKSNQATHVYNYEFTPNRVTARYGYIGGSSGGGRTDIRTFDDLGRLATVQDGSFIYAYYYDLDGDVLLKNFPSGEKENATYDGMDRQLANKDTAGNGSVLFSYTYKRDAAGNLRRMVENKPGLSNPMRITTMDYDKANRLKVETVSTDGGRTSLQQTSYDYDNADNRTSKSVSNGTSTTYSYNSLSQLTDLTDSDGRYVNYTYDPDGNRDTRTEDGAVDQYGYDAENRLVSLDNDFNSYSYAYDYRSRRVVRNDNANIRVVFSGGTSIQEYRTRNSPVLAAEFVRGSDMGGGVGGILFSVRAGSVSNFHYDGRGDVVTRTNSAGTVTYQAAYEAWGTRPAEFGTSADRQRANTKEEDPSGLLNEGMRYRDLETGSFITRDPMGMVDGPNLYAYVRQNPWTKFDPEGLEGYFPRTQYERDGGTTPDIAVVHAAGGWVNEHPKTMGVVKTAGSVGEIAVGIAGSMAPTGVTQILGGAAIAHGGDGFQAGVRQVWNGTPTETFTQQAIAGIAKENGASSASARTIGAVGDGLLGIGLTLGVSVMTVPVESAASIASTADELTAAASRARGTVGTGNGGAHGTRVHSAFEQEVNALGNSNLSTEISYQNGQIVPRGQVGSVRLDVVEGPQSAPTAIFDLKTGGAALTPQRILQIQSHIPGGTNVPVSEIR